MTLAADLERKRPDFRAIRYRGAGFRFYMGEMLGIDTVMPISDFVTLSAQEVVARRDYELDRSEPGNRLIYKDHVEKIKRGLRRHSRKLLVGSAILAVDPDSVRFSVLSLAGNDTAQIEIGEYELLSPGRFDILDFQHRDRALRALWHEVVESVADGDLDADEVAQMLKRSSVPVLIVLEHDRDEVSRLFVTMASTKPISPSLIAVMDRERLPNRFGLAVAQRAQLLAAVVDGDVVKPAGRLEYQRSTATKDTLYGAAAIRSAAANLFIGFKDRTPEQREQNLAVALGMHDADAELDVADFEAAVDEAVGLFDYAYQKLPGWQKLRPGVDGALSASAFRSKFVLGSAAGLYVVAGVLAAARLSGVNARKVIEAMSAVPWEKGELVKDGEQFKHPLFEGTLVITEPVWDEAGTNIIEWRTRTGGGNRTAYENATRAVLEWLAKRHAELKPLASANTFQAIGVSRESKRGRPRKGA